jgi:uncharacterized membrane protein
MSHPHSVTPYRPAFLALGLVTLFTVTAFALRLIPAWSSGLGREEAQVVALAGEHNIRDLLGLLRTDESHPPFFYFLLNLWMLFFGESDRAVRLLPVLLGTGLVPLLYTVGRRVWNPTTGVIAAGLATITARLVQFSAEVRPTTLLPLLGVGAIYGLWLLLAKGGTRNRWAGYILANVALLYTHHWAIAFWGVQVLVLIGFRFWGLLKTKELKPWFFAHLAIAALYAPWVGALVQQVSAKGEVGRLFFPQATAQALTLIGIPTHTPEGQAGLMFLLVGFALITFWLMTSSTSATLTSARRNALWGTIAFLAVPLILILLIIPLSPLCDLTSGRYNLTLRALLLLIAAQGLAQGVRYHKKQWEVRLGSGLLGLLLALLVTQVQNLPLTLGSRHSNAQELAMKLTPQITPDDLVLIAPEEVAPSFNRYFAPKNEQITFPVLMRQERIATSNMAWRHAEPDAYLQTVRRLQKAHAAGQTVWFVTYDKTPEQLDLSPRVINLKSEGYAWQNGITRSRQLFHFLTGQYGTSEAVTTEQWGDETLTAYRFSP